MFVKTLKFAFLYNTQVSVHYNDVIMRAKAPQITSLMIVY